MSYTQNVVSQQEQKRSKKTIAKAAIATACAGALAVGGVMAYLTATDTKSNSFTVAEKAQIQIVEENWNADDAENLIPLQKVNKDPQIQNKSAIETLAFMRVDIPVAQVQSWNDDGTTLGSVKAQELFKLLDADGNVGVNSGWVEIVNNGTSWGVGEAPAIAEDSTATVNTHYYYYNGALQAEDNTKTDDITAALFNQVQLINFADESHVRPAAVSQDQFVDVAGFGIQALGFGTGDPVTYAADDYLKAWTSYIAQNTDHATPVAHS